MDPSTDLLVTVQESTTQVKKCCVNAEGCHTASPNFPPQFLNSHLDSGVALTTQLDAISNDWPVECIALEAPYDVNCIACKAHDSSGGTITGNSPFPPQSPITVVSSNACHSKSSIACSLCHGRSTTAGGASIMPNKSLCSLSSSEVVPQREHPVNPEDMDSRKSVTDHGSACPRPKTERSMTGGPRAQLLLRNEATWRGPMKHIEQFLDVRSILMLRKTCKFFHRRKYSPARGILRFWGFEAVPDFKVICEVAIPIACASLRQCVRRSGIYLDFSRCTQMRDSSVAMLCHMFQAPCSTGMPVCNPLGKLKGLNFDFCNKLSDKGLEALLTTRLPFLEVLTLRCARSKNLTGAPFEANMKPSTWPSFRHFSCAFTNMWLAPVKFVGEYLRSRAVVIGNRTGSRCTTCNTNCSDDSAQTPSTAGETNTSPAVSDCKLLDHSSSTNPPSQPLPILDSHLITSACREETSALATKPSDSGSCDDATTHKMQGLVAAIPLNCFGPPIAHHTASCSRGGLVDIDVTPRIFGSVPPLQHLNSVKPMPLPAKRPTLVASSCCCTCYWASIQHCGRTGCSSRPRCSENVPSNSGNEAKSVVCSMGKCKRIRHAFYCESCGDGFGPCWSLEITGSWASKCLLENSGRLKVLVGAFCDALRLRNIDLVARLSKLAQLQATDCINSDFDERYSFMLDDRSNSRPNCITACRPTLPPHTPQPKQSRDCTSAELSESSVDSSNGGCRVPQVEKCTDASSARSRRKGRISAILETIEHFGSELLVNIPMTKPTSEEGGVNVWTLPLCMAIEWCDVSILNLLLKRGACVEVWDYLGKSPLARACETGNTDIVDVLLDSGASPNPAGHLEGQHTPLNIAIRKGDAALVRLLLGRGAEFGGVSQCSQIQGYKPPLYVACECMASSEIISELLICGANPNWTCDSQTRITPTLLAFKRDANWLVPFLEAGAGATIQTQWILIELLICSVSKGNLEGVVCLTQRYPDLLKIHHSIWSYPHIQAARLGQAEILKYCLENGSDANAVSHDKFSALHVAAEEGQHDCVRVLLSHGGHVNSTDIQGRTPLHIACLENRPSVVDVVLVHGANANIRDLSTNRETPLMSCIRARHGAMASHLMHVALTLNVDVQDSHGRTALSYALFFGQYSVAEQLMERGASVVKPDNAGDTPLKIVVERLNAAGSDKKVLRRYLKLHKMAVNNQSRSCSSMSCSTSATSHQDASLQPNNGFMGFIAESDESSEGSYSNGGFSKNSKGRRSRFGSIVVRIGRRFQTAGENSKTHTSTGSNWSEDSSNISSSRCLPLWAVVKPKLSMFSSRGASRPRGRNSKQGDASSMAEQMG